VLPDHETVMELQRRRVDDAYDAELRVRRVWAWLTLIVLLLLWAMVGTAVIGGMAHAGSIPEACRAYQREITVQAHNAFGIARPPIANLAAQMQQESGCNPSARSPFAAGLTQFTPGTASDMAKRYPTQLGAADPLNPRWAIAAQALYMRDLTDAAPGATECDTFAFGLSGYNGGAGWLARDRAVCLRTPGCDPGQWFGHVELTPDRRRAPQFIAENRGYPKRILLRLVPDYADAGYPGATLFCGVRAGSITTAPVRP
jgi:hypothetical protein